MDATHGLRFWPSDFHYRHLQAINTSPTLTYSSDRPYTRPLRLTITYAITRCTDPIVIYPCLPEPIVGSMTILISVTAWSTTPTHTERTNNAPIPLAPLPSDPFPRSALLCHRTTF